MLSYSCAGTKCPGKSRGRKGREGGLVFFASQCEDTVILGKAWRQKPEVAGHTVAEVRKQEVVNTAAQLTSSFSWNQHHLC